MDSSWVAIVDDDITAARGLEETLRGDGLTTRRFTTSGEFLTQPDENAPGCVVAKLVMREMSGLELQRQLAARESSVPVVFIAAGDDVATIVRAMKAGAVSCLRWPAREAELVAAVREAISRDTALRAERATRRHVSDLIGALTAREREVLNLVVAGLPNKQIAFRLGIAEKTIKVHRWRLMRKLQVRTPVHLVRLVAAGGISSATLPHGRKGALLGGAR